MTSDDENTLGADTSSVIKAELSVVINNKDLNSNLRNTILKKLQDKYLQKLYKNFIIKDISSNFSYSTRDSQGTVLVLVDVTEYLKYEVDQVIKGTVSLKTTHPSIYGDCIKLTIEGVTRQIDCVVTSDGKKYFNDSECNVRITKLYYIQGMIYKGTCNIVD